MLLSIYRICLLSLLSSLAFAQFQFLQPDGNLADRSQSFSVGSTLDIQWKAGWSGILAKQVYVDLFLTDFDANSYVNLIASTWTNTILYSSVLTINREHIFGESRFIAVED